MKQKRRPWILYLGAPVLVVFLVLHLFDQRPILAQESASKADPNAVAVVELFTSEGCSSCPPADALLEEISRQAEKSAQRVYTLAFHVDYWDKLGWPDPFADAAYTARQRAYGRTMRLRTIYTPQMVINGSAEFVGSSRSKARKALEAALREAAQASLELKRLEVKGAQPRALRLAYSVKNAPEGAVLQLALAERGLSTVVERGENGGRTLKHHDVVRAFRSQPLQKGAGELEWVLPAGVRLESAHVVGFVQLGETGSIVGGAALKLVP